MSASCIDIAIAFVSSSAYAPFSSLRSAVPMTAEQTRAARTKELARQAAARQTARKRATRVNPQSNLAYSTGEAKQQAEIRKEMASA